MIKRFTFLFFLTIISLTAFSQEVKYRVILIGDAGEMNPLQMDALKNAANHVIPQKTSVFFLGDNIYPRGMALPGSREEELTKTILQSQFAPMRKMGAAVYFIPGNHDWDKSGQNGLAKILQQGEYLKAQNDSLLQLIPANGCPDPVAVQLTDQLTVIAYDSEWWLFPYNKQNPSADCDCNTKEDVAIRMKDLLAQNRGKVILVASHHPFQSYGAHGGYYTLKDHIFPLTVINRNLYVPLPIIGSAYPLLRTTLLSPEDLKHPLYKEMIKSVNDVFGSYPNATYVAGHEHGLQLIKGEQLQIISGAGSKKTPNQMGKNALFHESKQGYVLADQLQNNDMRYEYYTFTDSGVQKVFSYTKPYVTVLPVVQAQIVPLKADSIVIKIKPDYDSVSLIHRKFLGENYRKEYAVDTKVPVIRISEISGGLKAVKRGGGHQSYSLRLEDKDGKEWVLRSVEKYPDVLLPPQLRETFARDVLKDNMSAQHPFTALVVPDIAEAVGVPHTKPIIGWVSPDINLGEFSSVFANTLCLLEEREPLGDSDNSPKMMEKLTKDNDNTYDGPAMLRAKALDVLIGDWDRHEDQWRWKPEKTKDGVKYQPVPRDRDQVFYRSDGILQRYAQSSWLLPFLQGYERNIKRIHWYLWEGRDLNSRLTANLDENQWNRIITDFCAELSDEVFEKALKKLPEPSYSMRHDQLLAQLKERRQTLPAIMNEYYRFLNKIVDLEVSDKNELIHINDAPGNALAIMINKISKEGNIKDVLFNRVFDPAITKEIRLYLHNGDDSVILNNKTSAIKLRIIGGKGDKVYDVQQSDGRVLLYGKEKNATYTGDNSDKLTLRLSNDSANVAFVPKDQYKRSTILPNAGYNNDDGLLFGLTYNFIKPGFRKSPYGTNQSFSFLYSFATAAFKFRYKGEWINALGKADIVVNADAFAPNNTQNFFGLGNETIYNPDQQSIRYFRTRFNIYQVQSLLRWRGPKSMVSIGPAFQYYGFDADDNAGRFITNSSQLHTSDSAFISQDKLYGGLVFDFSNDTRNNKLLPTLGSYFNFKVQAYKGLKSYSNSFSQITANMALYKNLDARANFVLADRFGGGVNIGRAPFYQSQFLGGEGNLLGYRQYRFAGQQSFYNNLELRARLGDFVSYVLPGQIGLLGFYDAGRVWRKNENSEVWHHGVGGGLYFHQLL